MSAPLEVWGLLVQRWRTITVFAVLGIGAGLTYSFVAPPWYSSQLAVVAADQPQNAAMSMLSDIPGAASLAKSNSSTDVQRIDAVMNSISVTDQVIAKFDLMDEYDCSYIEHARLALWKHCSTSVERKSGVLTLSCEDQDPKRAMEMTAFFGEVGNRVFGRVSVSTAREERRFLETQVVRAREDVDEASRKLRVFQEKYRILDLADQSKAVISAMASIQGELVSKQLQLSYLATFSSRNEANVIQLRQQIEIMQAKLKELEDSHPELADPGPRSADPKFFPDAMRVPELRFELEQLFRNQKIQEMVYFQLTQRYATARVDEARDTPTFGVLDSPTLPTFRSRPLRVRSTLMGLIGGLALAGAWIVTPAWWRRRRDPVIAP